MLIKCITIAILYSLRKQRLKIIKKIKYTQKAIQNFCCFVYK